MSLVTSGMTYIALFVREIVNMKVVSYAPRFQICDLRLHIFHFSVEFYQQSPYEIELTLHAIVHFLRGQNEFHRNHSLLVL